MIERITHCWAHGPSKEPPIEVPQPVGNIKELFYKGKQKKAVKTTVSSRLSDDDFHMYLTSRLIKDTSYGTDGEFDDDLPIENLVEMARILLHNYQILQRKANQTLNLNILLCQQLNRAKVSFMRLKKRDGLKLTWTEWVRKTTNISFSHVKRMQQMSDIVKSYPKLAYLDIFFTELYNRRRKIVPVFATNKNIMKQWLQWLSLIPLFSFSYGLFYF